MHCWISVQECIGVREARFTTRKKRGKRIVVQGHGFMLNLTWQWSRFNEFLPFLAPQYLLPFFLWPFSRHSPPCLACPFSPAPIVISVLSWMELGTNALTQDNWADPLISRSKEGSLTPHSSSFFPLLLAMHTPWPLLLMWFLGKSVQLLKTGVSQEFEAT